MADRWASASQHRHDRGRQDARTRAARFAARLRLDWWWIAILVICGSFQIYRGAPVDGVFFLAAGAALLADAAGWLTRLARYPLPGVHLAVQITFGAIAVAIIVFAPQFSLVDLIVVGVIGVIALVVAWRDDDTTPGSRSESDDPRSAALRRAIRRSAILWAAAGIVLCLRELVSFFLAMPSPEAEFDHPPLSDIVQPIAADPVGRGVLVALWLLAGWALLRRGRHP